MVVFSDDSGNWIDFENDDASSTVILTRISPNTVQVTVISKDFNFKSIGALNTVEEVVVFSIDTTVPAVTGLAILPLENVSNLVGMVFLVLLVVGIIFGARKVGSRK